MIIKRILKECKNEELGKEIQALQDTIDKLEKELARIDKFKDKYESESRYKLDKEMVLDEISDYKLEIEMLRARQNTL